jgi:hypothetical protein
MCPNNRVLLRDRFAKINQVVAKNDPNMPNPK